MQTELKTLNNLRRVSRRNLLKGAAALAAVRPTSAPAQSERTVFMYVGTYTPNGEGIYLFRVDTSTGKLTRVKVFPSEVNPAWIAFSPDNRFLYSANEISNFAGTTTGSVSAYSVNGTNGDLTLINTVTSGGAGPAHLSVDPSGKWVLVANYGGGNVAVIPVLSNGSLGNPTDIRNDVDTCTPACTVGPTRAEKAPEGSFAISGHDAPHAHMIQTDKEGNFVFAADLGLDRLIVWRFDRTAGKLLDPRTIMTSAGAGPRHFAFHPNGRWFYLLNEEASTLVFMTYDASSGTLTTRTEISTLPEAFKGTNFTSEIMVSRDGRFVYCANRLHDTIAVFRVESTGEPERINETWTRGDYPRSFNIEPGNRYMYVCNHRGDSIVTLAVERDGAELVFTGDYTAVGSPAVIQFLVVD